MGWGFSPVERNYTCFSWCLSRRKFLARSFPDCKESEVMSHLCAGLPVATGTGSHRPLYTHSYVPSQSPCQGNAFSHWCLLWGSSTTRSMSRDRGSLWPDFLPCKSSQLCHSPSMLWLTCYQSGPQGSRWSQCPPALNGLVFLLCSWS